MGSLITKQGNIRGAKIHLKINGKDWKKFPLQGYAIEGNFCLGLTYDDDLDIEIILSEDALDNMLIAVDKYVPYKERKTPFSEAPFEYEPWDEPWN